VIVQVLNQEMKIPSVIWLGRANKYLEHNRDNDEVFLKEFDYIWHYWKYGKFI